MNAKAPSPAWTILTSMVEDQNGTHARENAENEFESLSMLVDESMREYVARGKGLARAVEFHGVEVTEEKICRRILNGLPPSMHYVREAFALKYEFTLVEPEQALVNVEALNRRQGGADGHALTAGFRPNRGGRRGGSGGRQNGRGGRDGAPGNGAAGTADDNTSNRRRNTAGNSSNNHSSSSCSSSNNSSSSNCNGNNSIVGVGNYAGGADNLGTSQTTAWRPCPFSHLPLSPRPTLRHPAENPPLLRRHRPIPPLLLRLVTNRGTTPTHPRSHPLTVPAMIQTVQQSLKQVWLIAVCILRPLPRVDFLIGMYG